MTRINVVDPSELVDLHLIAEYREMPRIPTLVRKALARADKFVDQREYVLGSGHVRFFYRRLGFLKKRYEDLVAEMRKRGINVNYPDLDLSGIPEWLIKDWIPDEKAVRLNRSRIEERLSQMRESGIIS